MASGEYYDDIWDAALSDSTIDDIQDRTGYSEAEIEQAHLEIFLDMVPYDYNDAQELQMWADYVEAMIEGGMTQNEFFEMYDIDSSDFDWDAWREAMGY